jgi:hypothetical protein
VTAFLISAALETCVGHPKGGNRNHVTNILTAMIKNVANRIMFSDVSKVPNNLLKSLAESAPCGRVAKDIVATRSHAMECHLCYELRRTTRSTIHHMTGFMGMGCLKVDEAWVLKKRGHISFNNNILRRQFICSIDHLFRCCSTVWIIPRLHLAFPPFFFQYTCIT